MIIIKKNSTFIISRNTCKKLAEHYCSAKHWLKTSGLDSNRAPEKLCDDSSGSSLVIHIVPRKFRVEIAWILQRKSVYHSIFHEAFKWEEINSPVIRVTHGSWAWLFSDGFMQMGLYPNNSRDNRSRLHVASIENLPTFSINNEKRIRYFHYTNKQSYE